MEGHKERRKEVGYNDRSSPRQMEGQRDRRNDERKER